MTGASSAWCASRAESGDFATHLQDGRETRFMPWKVHERATVMGTMAQDVQPADTMAALRSSLEAHVGDAAALAPGRPGVAGAHPAPGRRPALAGPDLRHRRCGDEQAPGPVDPHAPSPDRHRRRGARAVHDRLARARGPRWSCGGPGALGSRHTWPRCSRLFRLYGLYERDSKRLGHSTLDDVPQVFHAVLIGTLGMWAYLKLVPAERPVLGQAALFFALNVTAVLAARSVVRNLTRRALPPERVLIVGGGEGAQLLLRKIRSCSYLRLHPVGFLDDARMARPPRRASSTSAPLRACGRPAWRTTSSA